MSNLILLAPVAIFCIVLLAYFTAKRTHNDLHLVNLSAERGQTTTSPYFAGFVAMCLTVCGALTIIGANQNDPDGHGLVVSGLGFAVLCTVLFGPFLFHRWEWDEKGLRWHGLMASKNILWTDIRSARSKRYTNGEFVVFGRGRAQIEWSVFTLGAECLFAALAHYRPDLTPEAP